MLRRKGKKYYNEAVKEEACRGRAAAPWAPARWKGPFGMSKSEGQKMKLFALKEIREQETDATHGIRMVRILELLSMRGIKAECKSISYIYSRSEISQVAFSKLIQVSHKRLRHIMLMIFSVVSVIILRKKYRTA